MRLLLIGAFPYPQPQGSQVYFQEQAHALRAAGAEVELLTYASGFRGPHSKRALDGFVHHVPPDWTSPDAAQNVSERSWSKPLKDLTLAMTLRQIVASKKGDDALDAILTHDAEASIAALLVARNARIPIVYCVHALFGRELSTYLKRPERQHFSETERSPSNTHRVLDRIGSRVDSGLARRVNGWIALTHSAQRVMRQFSTAPGALIPPPIPLPPPDPARREATRIAQQHGLEPDGFYLYSGNLKGYQELDILKETAQILSQALSDPERRPRLVLASHDPRGAAQAAEMPHVDFVHVKSPAEMVGLLRSARAALLMRRTEGRFPIKLANAIALGTPTITFQGKEWGLRDGETGLVVSPNRPAPGLAGAILRLEADDDLAARLRMGARALYTRQHRPDDAAERTLALLDRVLREHRTRRPRSPAHAG